MDGSNSPHPTFLTVAPRFRVRDLEQALAFYTRLGFQTTYQDAGFAILQRDGVSLHLNASPEMPARPCSVCWIAITGSDALHQQYQQLGVVSHPLTTQPWGLTQFAVSDPAGNLLLFAERSPDPDPAAG